MAYISHTAENTKVAQLAEQRKSIFSTFVWRVRIAKMLERITSMLRRRSSVRVRSLVLDQNEGRHYIL